MASKCFENLNNNLSQNDYISNIKSKTIYKTTKNGTSYQEYVLTNNNNCVVQAKNHEHLLHITKGKYLCDPPTYNLSIKGSINEGNLYITDLSGLAVVDTSFNAGNHNRVLHPVLSSDGAFDNVSSSTSVNYPGSIVDPSNTIFSALNCDEELNKGLNKTFFDISFSSNNKYTKIKTENHLEGFTYPTKIKL